jgi:hypothetical protein
MPLYDRPTLVHHHCLEKRVPVYVVISGIDSICIPMKSTNKNRRILVSMPQLQSKRHLNGNHLPIPRSESRVEGNKEKLELVRKRKAGIPNRLPIITRLPV